MKKIFIVPIITLLAFQLTACKSKETKEKNENTIKETVKTAPFSLKNAKNNISFTAYKTTEKIAVKGGFQKVEFLSNYEGNSLKEAMSNAEFKIPVSSIETNEASRNYKIKKFFFGVMSNTLSLTGKIKLTNDTKGIVSFTMNGITKDLPFDYTVTDKIFTLKTVMNTDNWNGQKAITSLNGICKDLHKGSDGISKTWNEVSIEVSSTFK